LTTNIAKKLTTIALKLIKDFEPSIQHSILEKCLSHFILQNVIHEYLTNVQSIKRNQEISNNMKFGITSHLVGPKYIQLVATRDIVCMFASSSSIGSSRGVDKVLGVDKRNIRKVLE
jgi:hypothetical protein